MRLKLIAALVAATCLSSTAIGANRSDASFVPPNLPRGAVVNGGAACPGSAIASLPFADSGTTCGATNTVTNYGGTCTLAFPYGGEDEVYQITLAAGNSIDISADLTGSSGDLALFLIGTCGNGATCIQNSNDAIGTGAGPEVVPTVSGLAAGTYFLYVDSYYDAGTAGSCGTFALSVTGSLPVELESFDVL